MTKPVRIGLLGAGMIGRVHLDAFARFREVELAGVASRSRASAEALQQAVKVARVYDTSESLLADPDIDAVVICTPNRWHEPLALAALERGKHVLIEKPMATTAEGALRIVRAAQRHERVVRVAQQLRYTWAAQRLFERRRAGAFGRVYRAHGTWQRRKGIPGWGGWFTRREEAGGGVLIDLGVHLLDLAFWLMGDARPVAVSGSTHAEIGPHRRGLAPWGKRDLDGFFDVEDLATALVRMDDGSTLSLDVSWAAHTDAAETPVLSLLGTDGGGVFRGPDRNASVFHEHQDCAMSGELQPPREVEPPFVGLARQFLAAIRDGSGQGADAISGWRCNLVIDAIYESSRTGREVRLPENDLV